MSTQSDISREKANEQRRHNGNYIEITNSTSEKILVYGPPRATDGGRYDTSWQVLNQGATTPKLWECNVLFIPSDRSFRSVSDGTVQGPAAIKYNPEKSVNLTISGSEYLAKGDPSDGIFHRSEINWSIPSFNSEDCQVMSKPRYEIPAKKLTVS